MSNLSELLPSGGGQNESDFVAQGNLGSGDAVAIRTDGKVELITETVDPTTSIGTAVTFDTNGIYTNSSTVYDANAGKIVVFYSDSSTLYGYAVVGTVSGTSITFGSRVAFFSAATLNIDAVYDSTNNKVVICYSGSSGYMNARVGTVSGNSISFGTAVVFRSSNCSSVTTTFDSSNGKVVCAYEDTGVGFADGHCSVGEVSGTSITFGSAVQYTFNVQARQNQLTFDTNSNKVVLAFRGNNFSSFQYTAAIVGTVSGNSISFGSYATLSSSLTSLANKGLALTFDSTNNKVVAAYADSASSNNGKSVVGTVSGTSISFGSATTFNSADTDNISATFDSNIGRAVIAYRDNGGTQDGEVLVGTVSGTSISFGSATTFESQDGVGSSCDFDTATNQVIISYQDATNSNYGNSICFTAGSINSTIGNLIGVTSAAITSGSTGTINLLGGINEAQSGLTIGQNYYVQTDGTISTVSTGSAVKLGQAITATTLNLVDLT